MCGAHLNRWAFIFLGILISGIRGNTMNCQICVKPVTRFRDALSQREWQISGICQKCQDQIFGKPTPKKKDNIKETYDYLNNTKAMA
jgi:hypothetical protein